MQNCYCFSCYNFVGHIWSILFINNKRLSSTSEKKGMSCFNFVCDYCFWTGYIIVDCLALMIFILLLSLAYYHRCYFFAYLCFSMLRFLPELCLRYFRVFGRNFIVFDMCENDVVLYLGLLWVHLSFLFFVRLCCHIYEDQIKGVS